MSPLLLLTLFLPCISSANSAIGNGGDTVTHYLETTRFALRETVRSLLKDFGSAKERKFICNSEAQLTRAQRKECRAFIEEALPQFWKLSQEESPVAFLLRDEPLWVEGPDGNMRQVDARTQLGPEGPIEFHFGSVRHYAPKQLLALMAHEFGHKIRYEGRFLTDNELTKAFDWGRHLIDSAAHALTAYAMKTGKISTEFTLNDYFTIEASLPGSDFSFGSSGASPRRFFDPGKYERFETAIGYSDSDLKVELKEQSGAKIHFRVRIHEDAGCRESFSDGERFTLIEIIKSFPPMSSGEPVPDRMILSDMREGVNPLCSAKPAPIVTVVQGLQFEMTYTGSSGQANRPEPRSHEAPGILPIAIF